MVGDIFYVEIAYSNFKKLKGRPILLFKELENDFLFLPLTSNLKREGVLVTTKDLEKGFLKKDSVIIVPKIAAIDKNLIESSKYLATLKSNKFSEVKKILCNKLEC